MTILTELTTLIKYMKKQPILIQILIYGLITLFVLGFFLNSLSGFIGKPTTINNYYSEK